jgi:hypothetical protein
MLLQKAAADRKAKQAGKCGSWGLGWSNAGDAEDELTEEQKRIKDLETVNVDQDIEIKKVKSEMV